MALIQKAPSRLKQLKLALILISVIGVTVGYAYFGLIKKPIPKDLKTDDDAIFMPSDAKKDSLRKSGINALNELSKQDIFNKLKKFGIWPLSIEPKGRTQPFIQKEEEEEN